MTGETTLSDPLTSAPLPTSIPSPSTGSLCTSDCGSCCCPGCHAINGTCYLCPAGFFSSDCLDHLQSSCRACPSGFFCPQGAVQPYLPSTTLALIVVCVVVAHLVLACIFSRAKRLTWAKSKGWIVVALVFGPLAWLLWWLRHRAVGRPQASDTMHQSLLAEPRASAPPLDSMQRSAETCAGGESPILKPSAPPAESEAVVGAVTRHNARPSVHAAASPAQHRPGSQALQLPQHDDISEDMTDQ